MSLKSARQEADKARRLATGGADPIDFGVARIAAE